MGDIFNVTAEILGQIDAIYNRAALVALPKEMRNQYTKHLMEIKRKLIKEKSAIKLNYKLMNYALSKGYEKDLVFDLLNNKEEQ